MHVTADIDQLMCRIPFIASEIFNCELNKITDAFFTARPQLNKRKESEFDFEPRRLSESHEDDEEEKDQSESREGGAGADDFLMQFL